MIAMRVPGARCLLAWGVPAGITLVVFASLIWPWWLQVQDLNSRIDRSREQITNYQRILATLPSLRAELEQVRNRDDTRAFYFDAETPALAGAQLQSQVQDIIRAAGADPISTQILPVDASERPQRIRVRIQFKGSTQAVLDVLYRIEAARPFLFVDQMSLRSSASNVPLRPQVQRRPGQVDPRERDELTLRLDIFGFSLGGSS
ncbi:MULTISPECIES: type II secretion system protein GspM [Thiorhodovibrio]|uniref:type II secretion system protein GspM n=1 Tax=Thiorhodovibrio TaxID=61593 RepID=UPI00191494A8|nr:MULTISPECIES: type II secretion system protein GspM [Thiorhodovibrio]MBK5971213.1 hypothetical protein [Thiorhodovibrio winogradskyi]WPL14638.1 General secretion pathway protein M [Thiorhodovibrio litoralis]